MILLPFKDRQQQLEAQRKHYRDNKEIYQARLRQKRKEAKERLSEYKKTLSCKECGEKREACLDFHHRDPSIKDVNISKAQTDRWTWTRLKKELDKCDVLCANCHRILHYNLTH